jgi:hypothetical protein
MRAFCLKCMVHGHEDRMHHDGGRLYLECAECGRETPGWEVESPHAQPQATAQPSAGALGFSRLFSFF